MPVTFARGHDDGIAGFEILGVAALGLNAHPALDDEEPLWTGVPVPVRSCTVRECHPVHADRHTGLVMGQALNRRAADEGRRIDRADRLVTRSKDAHRRPYAQSSGESLLKDHPSVVSGIISILGLADTSYAQPPGITREMREIPYRFSANFTGVDDPITLRRRDTEQLYNIRQIPWRGSATMRHIPCRSSSTDNAAADFLAPPVDVQRTLFMTTKLWITVSLGLLISACGDGSRPMSPTAPTPSASQPTYTVSGVVFAEAPTANVPIQGVRVRLEAGSFRQDAMTDGSGFYTLSGVSPGSPSITVSKDTYDTETRRVTINSDTRLDIRISRRVSYTLSGIVYEMTSSGRVPIEGVEVYCDGCGSEFGHTFAYTDASGFYSLAGRITASFHFW